MDVASINEELRYRNEQKRYLILFTHIDRAVRKIHLLAIWAPHCTSLPAPRLMGFKGADNRRMWASCTGDVFSHVLHLNPRTRRRVVYPSLLPGPLVSYRRRHTAMTVLTTPRKVPWHIFVRRQSSPTPPPYLFTSGFSGSTPATNRRPTPHGPRPRPRPESGDGGAAARAAWQGKKKTWPACQPEVSE